MILKVFVYFTTTYKIDIKMLNLLQGGKKNKKQNLLVGMYFKVKYELTRPYLEYLFSKHGFGAGQ